eukprot:GHVP01036935.1.p1 GENE.GHVP01036935.1~~GHVP01036935.1.p1  ORF type:complete len:105 (-),score=3.79 GHVP01036935.1:1058-1372(-)
MLMMSVVVVVGFLDRSGHHKKGNVAVRGVLFDRADVQKRFERVRKRTEKRRANLVSKSGKFTPALYGSLLSAGSAVRFHTHNWHFNDMLGTSILLYRLRSFIDM